MPKEPLTQSRWIPAELELPGPTHRVLVCLRRNRDVTLGQCLDADGNRYWMVDGVPLVLDQVAAWTTRPEPLGPEDEPETGVIAWDPTPDSSGYPTAYTNVTELCLA